MALSWLYFETINAELYIQVDNNKYISNEVKSMLMNDSRNVFENDTRKRY